MVLGHLVTLVFRQLVWFCFRVPTCNARSIRIPFSFHAVIVWCCRIFNVGVETCNEYVGFVTFIANYVCYPYMMITILGFWFVVIPELYTSGFRIEHRDSRGLDDHFLTDLSSIWPLAFYDPLPHCVGLFHLGNAHWLYSHLDVHSAVVSPLKPAGSHFPSKFQMNTYYI